MRCSVIDENTESLRTKNELTTVKVYINRYTYRSEIASRWRLESLFYALLNSISKCVEKLPKNMVK